MIQTGPTSQLPENLLQAKAKLFEKLPTFDANWQPDAIKEVRAFFSELMTNLDETATQWERKAPEAQSPG